MSSRMINKIANECGVERPMQVSIELAREWRAQAWRDYSNTKDDAFAVRDGYMERMYQKIADEEGLEKAEVVLQKKKQEETRYAHKRIKYARNKMNSGGTMKLEVLAPDRKSKIEITDKEQIENVLMQTNEEKFRLACATPFVQGQLTDDLGPRGLTKQSEDVLRGVYSPPSDTHIGAVNFIAAVQMSEEI